MGAYYDKLRALREEFQDSNNEDANPFQNAGTSPSRSDKEIAKIDAVNFAIADRGSTATAAQVITVNIR